MAPRGHFASFEIRKRISKSRKAILKFFTYPQTYNQKHAGGRSSKLSSADSRQLSREAPKGKQSASTLTTELNLPITKRRAQQVLSNSVCLKYKKPTLA